MMIVIIITVINKYSELEVAISKGKNNRKNAIRPCWDPDSHNNHKKIDTKAENYNMAEMDNTKSSIPRFGDRTKIIAKLRKPKSVASSLYPSIVTGMVGQGQELMEQRHVIQQVYIHIHMHMHICSYISIHIYEYTYMYIYIYICHTRCRLQG